MVYILTCGCCGSYYDSFNSDSEFDHDIGYGQCPKFREWISAKNKGEFDKIFSKIGLALSVKNQEKLFAFSRDKKKNIAIYLIDKGVIAFNLKRPI
jgi:hypothetical protein